MVAIIDTGIDYTHPAFINDDGTEEKYNLSMEEKLSLAQFELLKTEVVTMCKYESQGNITYNYPPDKRNVLHDDRCFALGLMCFYLAQLRHGTVFEKKKTEINVFFEMYKKEKGAENEI